MTSISPLSRRSFLGGAAATGSALALDACGGDAVPVTANPDLPALNSLLAAEYNAIKAYTAGIAVLQMPPTGDPSAALGLPLATIATNWQIQHRDHAGQLAATITSLGGTPITEASITFTAPTGFTGTIHNVLVLACNAELAAAIAYNEGVKSMATASARALAANIEGTETQHFTVLYALLKQTAAPNLTNILNVLTEIVPRSFVLNAGGMNNGLQSLADLPYA